MTRTLTVAEMTLREAARRRGVLALLLVLPLTLYVTRRTDHTGQAVRMLFMGLGCTVGTTALFSSIGSRANEPRLRLSGYRTHHLYLGRMTALWLVGLVLAVPLFGLVAIDQPAVRPGATMLGMLLCIAVAAPLGLLAAAVVPRELEGTLLLMVAVTLQMTVNPYSSGARLMPFWSSRELVTYAVDHTDVGALGRGLAHGVAYTAVLVIVVALISTRRLRTRPHLRFASSR